MVPDDNATMPDPRVLSDQEFFIVLKPVSHPELDDIRIDDNLFAIGRTEPPFESYPPEIVADLSRRHARIFYERGAVYIADLDSKNGTTVNGVNVQQKITRLKSGDEVCFGRALSYRVQLGARASTPVRESRLVSLTLTPDRDDLGLQPIVITQFPFLVSKADDAFSRYKDAFPHQVNYISRRHAHIFLKGGSPFIEDLGSTNGTFVGGSRLEERAVPLDDGDLLAFGGHHFVYKVSLQKEDAEFDPTVTKLASVRQGSATVPDAMHADKTTFVAAADSFLDIFCVDHAQKQDDELNEEDAKQAEEAGKEAEKQAPRGRHAIFLSELAEAFSGNEKRDSKRLLRRAGVAGALVVAVGMGLYFVGASERNLKELLEEGDYARASLVATESLQQDPANENIRAIHTEALLKANVPPWLAALKARNYPEASRILASMKKLGERNEEVQPLIPELEWMGDLERFVMGRGGRDAPIRLYADEDQIRTLLKRWEDGNARHQRAFTGIASHVPEFREPYAEALSHLRKLQSDESVYLPATDRLKASITAELDRDQPAALEPILKEYAEKYPRLGLDAVRQDLQRYLAIDKEARERRLGLLVMQLSKAKFSTPPFQQKFSSLQAGNRLPPEDVVQQVRAASGSWREGNTKQAVENLQKIRAGAWADAAAKEIEHKNLLANDFAALQKSRGSPGYDDRLLAFYGTLDPEEDVYFTKALDGDITQQKDKALARAQELVGRAQSQWQKYRDSGGIEGAQRIESGISAQFRNQARLLTEANNSVQQGLRIYQQLRVAHPAEWNKVQQEIGAEADLQRRSLQDLRMVLEPRLLRQKLALIGGQDGEERTSP
ncbi:MAG TPA: FHA domain-containing protein [Noviherbaspirillum sp.]